MPNERIPPDALLVSTNLSGAVTDIDDDPDSPDANWLTTTSGGASDCRVSFGTPVATPVTGAGLQGFRFQLRKNASAGNDPGYSIELWESGTSLGVTATGTISSTTGTVVELTWNASSLGTASGANVEARVLQTSGHAGTPGNRRYLEVGAIEWNEAYACPSLTGYASSKESSATTSHTVSLPANIIANELLIIVFSQGMLAGDPTTPSGWTLGDSSPQEFEEVGTSTYVYWKVASGSEGSTQSITTGTSATSSHAAYRFCEDLNISGYATWGVNASTSPAHGSIGSPAASAFFIAYAAFEGSATVSAYPADYPDGRTEQNVSGNNLASAVSDYVTGPLTPTYTVSSSVQWTSGGLYIEPPKTVTSTAALVELTDTISASGLRYKTVTSTAALVELTDVITASGLRYKTVTSTSALDELTDAISATGTVSSEITSTAALVEITDVIAASGLRYKTVTSTSALIEITDTITASGLRYKTVTSTSALDELTDTISATGEVTGTVTSTAALVELTDAITASGLRYKTVTSTAALPERTDRITAAGYGFSYVTSTAAIDELTDTMATFGWVTTTIDSMAALVEITDAISGSGMSYTVVTSTAALVELTDAIVGSGFATAPATVASTGAMFEAVDAIVAEGTATGGYKAKHMKCCCPDNCPDGGCIPVGTAVGCAVESAIEYIAVRGPQYMGTGDECATEIFDYVESFDENPMLQPGGTGCCWQRTYPGPAQYTMKLCIADATHATLTLKYDISGETIVWQADGTFNALCGSIFLYSAEDSSPPDDCSWPTTMCVYPLVTCCPDVSQENWPLTLYVSLEMVGPDTNCLCGDGTMSANTLTWDPAEAAWLGVVDFGTCGTVLDIKVFCLEIPPTPSMTRREWEFNIILYDNVSKPGSSGCVPDNLTPTDLVPTDSCSPFFFTAYAEETGSCCGDPVNPFYLYFTE